MKRSLTGLALAAALSAADAQTISAYDGMVQGSSSGMNFGVTTTITASLSYTTWTLWVFSALQPMTAGNNIYKYTTIPNQPILTDVNNTTVSGANNWSHTQTTIGGITIDAWTTTFSESLLVSGNNYYVHISGKGWVVGQSSTGYVQYQFWTETQ